MSWQAWFTLAVVAATVVVLARDLLPPAFAVLGATVTLLIAGVIDPQAAFAGFSNPAPITVAALYVLARAVEATGALDPLLSATLGGVDPERLRASAAANRKLLARIVAPTTLGSAFLNNTPIVAMLAPQLVDWAKQRGLSASPLLMPLSFATILGGLITAIGTSTNLVVSGLMIEAGMPGMGLFEIAAVGLPVAVIGGLLLIWLAPRLLPNRRPAGDSLDARMREFTMAMRVLEGGALDGKSVEDGGLRHLEGVFLIEIERDGALIAPVAPHDTLRGGDVLTFAGKVELVVDLQRKRGLESTERRHLDQLAGNRHTFFEAVIGAGSPLVGRTLRGAGFRGRYDAAVLAIHRSGQRIDAKLGQVPLRVGDTLLILADEGFADRWRESGDFLLIARRGGSPPARTRKAPAVTAIIAALMLTAGTGLLPILHAALIAAILLVAAGALTPNEARNAVDINVLVLIAASFGIGAAIETTGLADRIGALIVDLSAPLGLIGSLAGVFLATLILTELITNNAAAVLMFPIAISAAGLIGANPRGFAITVAVAASASFLTPIGYQTNTMVYGLGGYRFTDYPRLGLPLTLAVFAVAMVVIPLAWPL